MVKNGVKIGGYLRVLERSLLYFEAVQGAVSAFVTDFSKYLGQIDIQFAKVIQSRLR